MRACIDTYILAIRTHCSRLYMSIDAIYINIYVAVCKARQQQRRSSSSSATVEEDPRGGAGHRRDGAQLSEASSGSLLFSAIE